MTRFKRLLIIAGLVSVAAFFTACSGRIVSQVTYDDEGGAYQTFDFQLDEAYFGARFSEADTFMHNMAMYFDIFYGFEMERDAARNGYTFTRYLTPEMLGDTDDGDEDDGSNVTRKKTFFNNTIEIKSTTVFYELYDYVTGMKPVPEDSILYPILYGFGEDNPDTAVVEEAAGFFEIFTDKDPEDIKKVNLIFIHGNNYSGFFAKGAQKAKLDGYSYYSWDLTGDANRIITYGQKVPNSVGWYTMLLVAVVVFFGFAVIFVKFIQPRIDANIEKIRKEKLANNDYYNPYERNGGNMNKHNQPPANYPPAKDSRPPDPFQDYKDKTDGNVSPHDNDPFSEYSAPDDKNKK